MCFYVHSGLSDNEIRCAAWGIFRKVQETFEKHQANMPILNSSGQSPEDLPSDLILFHRVIGGNTLTADKIKELCGVISNVDRNLELYKTFPWEQKNPYWTPVLCTHAQKDCEDDQTPEFAVMPKELKAPFCDPDGEGPNWASTGQSYIGIYP